MGEEQPAQPEASNKGLESEGGESSGSAKPGPRRSWLKHAEGGPSLRALTLAGVLVAGVTGGVSVGVALALNPRDDQGGSVQYGDTHIYMDSEGAPGEEAPAPDRACGGSDSAVQGGWGPDRPTFTVDHPPPYTTLNAIRDNPNVGDERGMMAVRDAASTERVWAFEQEVEPGHTYRVRMYVHVSAPVSTMDDLGSLAAENTRLMVSLPTCAGNRIAANGWVASSTAFPREVWGGVTFASDSEFNLAYVEGSAMIESNAFPDGGYEVPSTDFLTSTGIPLGYETFDGLVYPGYQYAIYFSFEVRPQFAPD